MLLKVAFVLLGTACFVYGLFPGGCFPDYALSRPRLEPARALRLAEAELISAALFLYADRHDGKLPPSLESLKPDYLGQSVDTGFMEYYAANSKSTEPHDYRVIASEKERDAEDKFICIYGHRGVSLLRAGD